MKSPSLGLSSTVKETGYFWIQLFKLIIGLLYISLQMFPCSQMSNFHFKTVLVLMKMGLNGEFYAAIMPYV